MSKPPPPPPPPPPSSPPPQPRRPAAPLTGKPPAGPKTTSGRLVLGSVQAADSYTSQLDRRISQHLLLGFHPDQIDRNGQLLAL